MAPHRLRALVTAAAHVAAAAATPAAAAHDVPSSFSGSATVSVDPGSVTHEVAEATNGCHFSPLDHQLFYVYSQMIYDESFEQSIADKPLDKWGGVNNVSLGWTEIANGSLPPAGSGVRWLDDVKASYNGNVSLELSLPPSLPDGSKAAPEEQLRAGTRDPIAPRVGVAGRGLYHQGFALQQGKPYEGYVAVKAESPSTVHVRLEDWGEDPFGTSGGASLAHAALQHPGGVSSQSVKNAPGSL
jgi:hypothetical protein